MFNPLNPDLFINFPESEYEKKLTETLNEKPFKELYSDKIKKDYRLSSFSSEFLDTITRYGIIFYYITGYAIICTIFLSFFAFLLALAAGSGSTPHNTNRNQ